MDRQRSFVQLVVAFLLVFVSLSHALDSGKSTSEKTAAKGKTMLRSQAGALLKRDGASALGGGGNANNVVVQQAAVAGNTGSQAHQCPAENVEDLEEDDFTSVFKTGLPKDYFVYFFKPNEPNCEAFAPKYDCVGTEYKPLASTTHVAKFPASDHSVVRDEYDITVYPTLRFFPKGYIHTPNAQGIEYSGEMEKDNVAAWVHVMRGKTAKNVADHVPATNSIQIGTTPGASDVMEDGKSKADMPMSKTTATEDMLYLQVEDPSVDQALLCGEKGLASGKCMKAVSTTEKICQVRIARPTGEADRAKGGHRLWYKCISAGTCNIAAEVMSAPEPAMFHFKHECTAAARVGFKIGTVTGTGDVVNNGFVDQDWSLGTADPKATAQGEESSMTFSLIDTVEAGGFDVRPVKVQVGDTDLVTVKVTGDIPTVESTLRPNVYLNHPKVYNAALEKPASMSSVWNGHAASKAVDGSHGTPGESHLACAITGKHGEDPEPYWEVDLGTDVAKNEIVKHIRVWNTPSLDTQYRLAPVVVLVSAEPLPRGLKAAQEKALYSKSFSDIKAVYDYVLPANDAFARYVRVQLVNKDFLQLAEVEVFVVPSDIRCEDPISDHGFAICAKGGVNQPVSSKLEFTCKRPGTTNVQMTVPLFPQYHPNNPLKYAFQKKCSAEAAVDFLVGNSKDGGEIVDAGVVERGFVHAKTVKEALKTEKRKVISGDERVLVMYMQAKKDSTQTIKWPNMTVHQDDKAMNPTLIPWHLKPDDLTVKDTPTGVNVSFGCVKKGFGMVNFKLTYTPIFQPYSPIQYSILKECGGRPVGLNVHMAGQGKEEGTGKTIPAFSEEKNLVAIVDGVAQKDFSDEDKTVGPGQVPEEEASTTFYLDVPPTELEYAEGHRSAPKTTCRSSLFSQCRQLQKSHTHGAPVRASCEPNICSGDVFGLTHGPVMSGEAVGSGASAPEELEAANGKIPMKVHYHCTKRAKTTVTLTFQNEFYDPVSVSYVKHCYPWTHTTWGRVVVWTSGILGSVGFICAILFVGGQKSLYHRMAHGNSIDYMELEE